MKKFLCGAIALNFSFLLMTTILFSSITAFADNANYPAYIQQELTDLRNIRTKALAEYSTTYCSHRCDYVASIPADFKVLFLECQNVTATNGVTYTSDFTDDYIYSQIPEQFESLVEYLTDYNLNIVTDSLIIETNVTTTTDYVTYDAVADIVEDYAPYGTYDSVICFAPEIDVFGCPNVSIGARATRTGFGYSYCPISSADTQNSGSNDLHLYSVDLALHEWIHQLESFRNINVNNSSLIFPSADLNTSNLIASRDSSHTYSSTGGKYSTGTYTWENIWYSNADPFFAGREPERTSYYAAILNGTLYDHTNDRFIGMFPAFWRFFNGQTVLGEFYAQDSNCNYAYMKPRGVMDYSSLPSNTDSYKWRLIYSVEDNIAYIQSKLYKNWIFEDNYSLFLTRINYTNSGDFYIQNVGGSSYLSYNSSSNTFSYESFSASDSQKWTITYFTNGTFTISPKTNPSKYFDLLNGYDLSGNNVQLHSWTGSTSAQSWQIRQNSDGYFNIFPAASSSRMITLSSNSLTIETDSNSSYQDWIITSADGGKEIFNGNYQITYGNYYVTKSNRALMLSTSSATIWNFEHHPADSNYFYRISPINTSTILYYDVQNNYDIEGNTVQLYPETGYDTAQSWEIQLKIDSNGEYCFQLIPMLSRTRGLKFSGITSAIISTDMYTFYLSKVS